MTAVENALLVGMMHHNVEAHVIECDHYRIHGGMAVETDYIISVKPKSDKMNHAVFDSFK
mgnify:CR=1 FL=1|jgi:hypothetical protein